MTAMKISQFVATATILGKERTVACQESHQDGTTELVITPMTSDEVHALVGLLAGGNAPVVAAPAADPPKAADKPKKASTPVPAPAPAAEEKPAAKPEPKPEPAPEKPAEAKKADPPKAAEKPAAAKKAADKPAPKASGIALPDSIKQAASLKPVLVWLVDEGHAKNLDELVEKAVAIAPEVPVLAAVPKIEDRVRKANDFLDLFPEAPAAE